MVHRPERMVGHHDSSAMGCSAFRDFTAERYVNQPVIALPMIAKPPATIASVTASFISASVTPNTPYNRPDRVDAVDVGQYFYDFMDVSFCLSQ